MIAEIDMDILTPQLNSLFQFILFVCSNSDEDVAREATEFWLVIAEQSFDRFDMVPLLPSLLPVLLKNMIYSEHDPVLFLGNENDELVSDRQQDIKPRHHKSAKGMGESDEKSPKPTPTQDDDDDDYDDDDDDEAEAWNLRKCAAAALDVISTVCENQMLPHLLPLLTSALNDSNWKVREAGILALGAIADGCYEGMVPHLPGVMPVLIKTLSDNTVFFI